MSVIDHPVELLTDRYLGAHEDPFAFLAPFETDEMGSRNLFLWVSSPRPGAPSTSPSLLCDGQPVSITAQHGELKEIGLSHAPYPPPTPWGEQWYFRLPQATLEGRLTVLAQRFAAWLAAVRAGGQATDNLLFVLAVGILVWFVAYTSAYAAVHQGSPWWPVFANGAVLLVNASYRGRTDLYLPIYLLASLLEVAGESSLDLAAWKPANIVDRAQYSEWPIALTFEGGYHELGRFFDRLAGMSRLISVSDLNLKTKTKPNGRGSVMATCVATTFVFRQDIAAVQPTPTSAKGGRP